MVQSSLPPELQWIKSRISDKRSDTSVSPLRGSPTCSGTTSLWWLVELFHSQRSRSATAYSVTTGYGRLLLRQWWFSTTLRENTIPRISSANTGDIHRSGRPCAWSYFGMGNTSTRRRLMPVLSPPSWRKGSDKFFRPFGDLSARMADLETQIGDLQTVMSPGRDSWMNQT